jgi:hypothetical protein
MFHGRLLFFARFSTADFFFKKNLAHDAWAEIMFCTRFSTGVYNINACILLFDMMNKDFILRFKGHILNKILHMMFHGQLLFLHMIFHGRIL